MNWFARRLATQEIFCCQLKQDPPLAAEALRHMRLSESDLVDAVSPSEFCSRWDRFLCPNDTLIVYHPNTYRLLGNVHAAQPNCLVLKSIFRKWRAGFRSLEQLAEVEGVKLPDQEGRCRANQRLDLAVALVEHLRQKGD